MDENNYSREKCQQYFQEYKLCKKKMVCLFLNDILIFNQKLYQLMSFMLQILCRTLIEGKEEGKRTFDQIHSTVLFRTHTQFETLDIVLHFIGTYSINLESSRFNLDCGYMAGLA